jgi:Cu-Zn family superoxide dismutase
MVVAVCGGNEEAASASSLSKEIKMYRATTYMSLVVLGVGLSGCERNSAEKSEGDPGYDTNIGSPLPDRGITSVPKKTNSNEIKEAEASLDAIEGSDIDGDIEFKQVASGVDVKVSIEGTTAGKHGVHIHEKGDCSDIAGKSMGGHFNPTKEQHALPAEGPERHLGDLGNVEVNEDGKGEISFTMKGATLQEGEPNSLLGRAFVVHDGEDSGKAQQPAGDSGSPIACGVIKRG